MRAYIIILFVGPMLGCSASIVRQPDDGGRRPTGIVKYEYSHVSSIDAGLRRDAERKMKASCDGGYRITRERNRREVSFLTPDADAGGEMHQVTYHYIEYLCLHGERPTSP